MEFIGSKDQLPTYQILEESPSINLTFQQQIQDMDQFSTDSSSFTVGLFTLPLPVIPEPKFGSKLQVQVEILKLSSSSPTQNSMSEMVTNSVFMTQFQTNGINTPEQTPLHTTPLLEELPLLEVSSVQQLLEPLVSINYTNTLLRSLPQPQEHPPTLSTTFTVFTT